MQNGCQTIRKPDDLSGFRMVAHLVLAAILFLAFENRTQIVSKNDHLKTGRSGFRMLTVFHSRKFLEITSKMQASFVSKSPAPPRKNGKE
jgi:hypothetical protein